MDELETTEQVLYQKIGPKWYLFTEVGGDIHYCEVPNKVVDKIKREKINPITKQLLAA